MFLHFYHNTIVISTLFLNLNAAITLKVYREMSAYLGPCNATKTFRSILIKDGNCNA